MNVMLISASLAIFVAGCEADTSSVKFEGEERHADGLVIKRPVGFDAKPQPNGFELIESGERRSPFTISVHLTRDTTHSSSARYTSGEPEGSGGAVHTFSQSKSYGSCSISVFSRVQRKSQPSFLVAKAVLEHASASGC